MSSTPLPTLTPFDLKCDRYYTERNKTAIIYGGYQGIPENLLINGIAWLVGLLGLYVQSCCPVIALLILFAFLRKIAWDYGRIALVSRTEDRYLLEDDGQPTYNVWTSLFYGDHTSLNELRNSQESLDTLVHRQDKGFCAWIPAFFRIKDAHILQKSGRDAVQYLTFQRYLIIYMCVIVVLCIGVILPVNFQGDLEGDHQSFGHTTISNIDANSPILWLHTTFAVLFLIMIVCFMRHFSVNLEYEEDDQATKTLMISNISKDKCYRSLIHQHFQEAYPEAPVVDIQFAYNISKLISLDRARTRAIEGLLNSEAIYKQTGERPTLVPMPCGQCCCTCCGCKSVDAIEYYTVEELKYKALVDKEKVKAFQETLGICFVTFESDVVAARVFDDFKVSCKGAHNPMPSSVGRELNAHNWEVRYAPAPDNIYWENLSVSAAIWWMKAISVNFLLFVLLFFFTTPSLVLNLMNQGGYQQAVEEIHSQYIVQFLPTLILWIVSSLLPNIVYYSDYYLIGHWTRTAEHHAVMRKTFTCLVLMVLILPSLGLTSAKAAFEWLTQRDEDYYKFRWECIFIPDNGAFFVNYVITSAFIGTAAELVRIPELLLYAIKLACAKSQAERTSVRKSVLWEFQFGVQYAWMLCVFSVVMAYSIPCPLITPFGLVYLIFKHMVDRYNIYFAYGPSKIDKHIHASAINFVMVSVIILQCSLLFFTILRANMLQGILIFAMVALFLTLTIFFGRICFGWFKGLSPITYKHMRAGGTQTEGEAEPPPQPADVKPFIPSVLLDDHENEVINHADTQPISTGAPSSQPQSAASSYGAVDSDNVLIPPTLAPNGSPSQQTFAQ